MHLHSQVLNFIISTNFGIGSFLNVIFLFSQLWRIFKVKNSQGVSMITYAGFAYINLATVLYAWKLNASIMYYAYLASLIVNVGIIIAITIYRKNKNCHEG